MAKVTGKAIDRTLLRKLFAFVAPYKKLFWGSAVLIIVLSFTGVLRPYLTQQAIDVELLKEHDREGLLAIILLILGLIFLETILQFFQTLLAGLLGQSVTNDLRRKLYGHIIKLKPSYFDKNPIGMLVTRVVSDIETINDIFTEGLLIIFGDLLKLAAILGIMFYTNWELTLYCLIPIPVLIIATNIFRKAIRKSFQQVRSQVSRLNTFVQEHITGMSIVQVFSREKTEMKKFEDINKEHRKAHIDSVMAYSIFFPVVEILSAFSVAFVMWLGVGSALKGLTSFGELVAFVMYINLLYRPIRMLADRFNTLQMGMVGCERVFTILETEATIPIPGNASVHEIKGEVNFSNVTFSYNEGEQILKGISFHVNPGETVAVVGATGAGKTSIINVLGRMYEFEGGEVNLDGVSLRNVAPEELRRHMSIVLQDVFLFSDSVLNNITLHNPAITRERVEAAARTIGAHDFIMRLPGGYDFNVMERGHTLSVGQRQLISFLRAYVHEPRILILDEATSSIDSESEELIQRATEKLTQNRTSIIIAHRLSTVKNANRILVMDKGKIIEEGNHERLLEKDGAYARLYKLQFV
ncbi:MAG: ABC transporter ATP-binding protein [Flavobacteriales bacterium]